MNCIHRAVVTPAGQNPLQKPKISDDDDDDDDNVRFRMYSKDKAFFFLEKEKQRHLLFYRL